MEITSQREKLVEMNATVRGEVGVDLCEKTLEDAHEVENERTAIGVFRTNNPVRKEDPFPGRNRT